MKFLRNNWYWILSIVIGLGIGSIIIKMHRVQQQASETQHPLPDVAAHTPDADKTQMNLSPDSTSHETPNVEVPRKHRPIRIKKAVHKTHALKNIAPTKHIVTIPVADHDDVVDPPPPPPIALEHRRILMLPPPIDLEPRRTLLLDLLEEGKKRWDSRTGFCHVYPGADSQRQLEALISDMNPEEAIALLEEYYWYNEAILSRVSVQRAFKYLHTIQAVGGKVNEYAEKALAENPDNFEAKMKLILSETDDAKAAAGYKEILAKDPNNVGALLNLGYRTHYDDPEGALIHLTKPTNWILPVVWGVLDRSTSVSVM